MGNNKIAILGGGNLGTAIAVGLVKAKLSKASDITVTRRQLSKLAALKSAGFKTTTSNEEAVSKSGIIIICVQPKQVKTLMEVIGKRLDEKKHILVSTVTGVTTEEIAGQLHKKIPIVRSMPNTAIAIGASMTCICSLNASDPQLAVIRKLFDGLGKTMAILQDAARRGVHIRILTNSLESTDHPSVHAGFANERRWMLRAGIRIFELQGRNMLHAKSMVIDGRIAMVGSYNFDRLSESRNSEVALLVTDCQFAKQVSMSIAAHRSQATELHLGDLFRYEQRESNVSNSDFKRFRRLRIAAPLIERYL